MKIRPGTDWATAPRTSPSCDTWRSTSCKRTQPRDPCAASSSAPAGTTPTSPDSSLYSEVRLPCPSDGVVENGQAQRPGTVPVIPVSADNGKNRDLSYLFFRSKLRPIARRRSVVATKEESAMSVAQDGAVKDVLARVDADLDHARERLFELLRIPSISTQPDHKKDVQHAAEWLRAQLEELGLKTTIMPTAGHPVVLGTHPGPAGTKAPRVLFYGHYDVQPADPLELWNSPPFEPQLVDGPRGKRIVGRGAVDAKGQSMMFIEALRAWKTAGGGIPAPVIVLMEGEEEIGSPNLEPFLKANKDALGADFALISDTNMWDVNTPGLTTRLRGMCNCE